MKRTVRCLILICLTLFLSVSVLAADSSRSYTFDLSANGGYEVQAKTGDVIAVTLRLVRTDAQEAALMYAMQDEITYDGGFFELVDGGAIAASGVATQEIGLRDGSRAYYMNYLSLVGGDSWEADTMVGLFQLRVTGESGSSVIENRNFLVSTADGSDVYTAEATSITVTVSDECTVRFDTGEGSAVESQTLARGARVQRPDDPTREGYALRGWYRDFDRTQPWNFENDTVSGNMTLYAGWTEALPEENAAQPPAAAGGGTRTVILIAAFGAALLALIALLILNHRVCVHFSAYGTEIPDVKLRSGSAVPEPPVPEREGFAFAGWYLDRARKERWDFETMRVKKSMTLYGKWLAADGQPRHEENI